MVRAKAWLGAVLLCITCGDDNPPATESVGTTNGETGINIPTTTESTSDTGEPQTTTAGTETAGSSGGCFGETWQCSDGMDNDGDGKIDADDPECTGPCDNDEGSFQTGIPGDNMDCKQDCFFDGNSGQGDDGCNWDLKCDPENPGEGLGCDYTGGNNCSNMPPNQTSECIDFCAGLVPNGCDCFGCCTIETPDGEIHVYLGSGPDCSLDNLDACNSCTPSEDCGNDCDPAMCEWCFGQEAPPEECDTPECPEGVEPCTPLPEGGSTCPEGLFCLTGCCIDYNPEG